MKQRRFIAWMLMVVSMVMLTASVLPHHHHQEILCLQHDAEECACSHGCSEPHGHHAYHHEGHCSHDKHACGSSCITNFQTVTPDETLTDVSPGYSFYSLIYMVSDILSIPLPLSETKANLSYFYLEKLHSICFGHVMGLRAPPVLVA